MILSYAANSARAQEQAEQTGITDKVITLGSCRPLTGPLAARGLTMTHGVEAYFSYVNEHGGIEGRQVKLTSCDDHYDPELAIGCFNSCLKDKVFAGAFFLGSAAITKYVRMSDVDKIPLVGFNTTPPIVCEKHAAVFNLRPCYGDEIRRTITELYRHNLRRIAVLYQGDALGAGAREAAVAALKKFGADLVSEASFGKEAAEVDEAYRRIKESQPDACLVAAGTVALKQIMHLRQTDPKPILYFSLASLTDALLEDGKSADGVIVSQILPRLESNDKAVELYRQLLKKYFPGDQPHTHGLEAFLNAILVTEALKRCGHDLTRTKFVKTLESMHDFDLGLTPSYIVNYSPSNHVAWSDKVISFLVIRDGKLTPVTNSDWKVGSK
jgi:ABC-type branched-subunit amino acid transport system substrate-binding protein